MDTESIAYVGPKKVKNDNVAGTNVVWHGYGDIQSVPKTAASKLLAYPSVFITGAQFAASHAAPKAAKLTAADLAELEAQKLADEEAARLAAEQNAGDPDNGAGLSSAVKQEEDKAPAGGSSRDQAIKAALVSMDQSNEEHFSKATGNPIIAAVREIAGDKTISLKEINAAWSALKTSK